MKDFILLITNKVSISIAIFMIMVVYIGTIEVNPIDKNLVEANGNVVAVNK